MNEQKISGLNLYFLRRLARKKPQNNVLLPWSRIQKIALIVDWDYLTEADQQLVYQLSMRKNYSVIALVRDRNFNLPFFMVKKHRLFSLKWLNRKDLQQLLEQHFDLSFTYCRGELTFLAYATVYLNASFKVCSDAALTEFCQLIMLPKLDGLESFVNQAIKYIQTIKPEKYGT